MVQRQEGIPVGCIVAFDRQERGTGENGKSAVRQFEETHDIPVFSVADLDTLIEVLREKPTAFLNAEKTLPKILAYREKHGAGSI